MAMLLQPSTKQPQLKLQALVRTNPNSCQINFLRDNLPSTIYTMTIVGLN